jgi:hypothetical protein
VANARLLVKQGLESEVVVPLLVDAFDTITFQ